MASVRFDAPKNYYASNEALSTTSAGLPPRHWPTKHDYVAGLVPENPNGRLFYGMALTSAPFLVGQETS